MKLRSLQWRLVLIIMTITISLMIIVGVFLNSQVETIYYDNFKKSIDTGFNGWEVDGKFTYDQLKEELSGNKIATRDFSINEDYKSYAIVDKNGRIAYAYGRKFDERDQDVYLNEILSSSNLLTVLANSGSGDSARLNRTNGSVFYDYAKRVLLSDGDYVILYFRYDREAWQNAINDFNGVIINSLLIAVIAALIIGYLLSKTITVPVVSIMHKARKIAQGDFEEKLEVKSEDEIGKLSEAFNYMAGELKDTLSEISSEKNKIETILNYMTDGVIAFNMKGEVIHSNPAALKMLGLTRNSTVSGFNEFSSSYGLGINLEEITFFESTGVAEKNFKVNDRFLKAYFALIIGDDRKLEGIIAVLQDITEQQKLENMRREFVANVSHELKTPLTSIKSYTETILDSCIDDRDTTVRFLNVINSESDRMARLVRDLLQLSSLDNQQTKWNIKKVNFVTLAKNCVEKLYMEACNKKQELKSFVIGEIPEIDTDPDRLEQVLLNILMNAIKYTAEGGSITVYIGKLYSEVYVKITDTGIGIPEEDISRIFERFYRVDKARSREMGGTGLGLSIAKEILESLGGSISITSEFGKGTEVTVKLPIAEERPLGGQVNEEGAIAG